MGSAVPAVGRSHHRVVAREELVEGGAHLHAQAHGVHVVGGQGHHRGEAAQAVAPVLELLHRPALDDPAEGGGRVAAHDRRPPRRRREGPGRPPPPRPRRRLRSTSTARRKLSRTSGSAPGGRVLEHADAEAPRRAAVVARRARDSRTRRGARVLRVPARDGGEHEAAVVGGAAQGPDLVEGPGEGHGSVARDEAVGRPQPGEAAVRGRVEDRARGLGAEGEADEAGRGGAARARGASPRSSGRCSRECGTAR